MSESFQNINRRSLLRAAVLAAASTSVVTLGGARPALAAGIGDPITRSETLLRGKYWVDQEVPYSQSGNYSDGDGHSYRRDCSGYVSMMWHLSKLSNGHDRDTATFANWSGWTQLGSYGSLKAGDALHKNGHMLMFDRWADEARSRAYIYQQRTWNDVAQRVVRTTAQWRRDGFRPYRYDNILEDAPPVSPDPHGPLWMRTRSASGAWQSNASEADANTGIIATAAAGLPDGSLHVFVLIKGSGVWHRTRSATGAWSGSTKIDANGAVSALSASALPNGTLNVQTIVPGSGVYNRTRNTNGTWTGAGQIDANGDIVKVSSAGLADGTLQVQTLVPDAGVWNRARSATGTWQSSATKIDDNDEIIAIAAASLPNGQLAFFAAVAESGLWHRTRSAGGSWGGATKIDANEGLDAVSAAGLPDGTVQVTTTVVGSGLWHRSRSSAGVWQTSATHVDVNKKIFGSYSAALSDGTLYLGSLVNVA